jgi:hypothetical protein
VRGDPMSRRQAWCRYERRRRSWLPLWAWWTVRIPPGMIALAGQASQLPADLYRLFPVREPDVRRFGRAAAATLPCEGP